MIRKNHLRLYILTLLLILGCTVVKDIPPQKNNREKKISVSINISCSEELKELIGSKKTRTIIPGIPVTNIEYYILTGNKSGEPEKELKNFSDTADNIIVLTPGEWNFKLNAYNAENQILLTGSIENFTIDSSVKNLSFILRALPDGSGNINITINVPMNSGVTRVETHLNETLLTDPDVVFNSAINRITLNKTGLHKGDYLVRFRFFNALDELLLSSTQLVIILPNITTARVINISMLEFRATPDAPFNPGAGIAPSNDENNGNIRVTWIDNSNNETGFKIFIKNETTGEETETTAPASRQFHIISLPRNEEFTFRIMAFNDFGTSDITPSTPKIKVPWLVYYKSNLPPIDDFEDFFTDITDGEILHKPTDMTVPDYVLKGFFTDSTFTTPWIFGNTITGNLVIHTKWIEIEDEYREMIRLSESAFNQKSVSGESFQHTVLSFDIGKYEVTYELWYSVREYAEAAGYNFQNPGQEGGIGEIGEPPVSMFEPVTNISWYDAVVWCNAYSQMNGLEPVYKDSYGSVIKDSRITNYALIDEILPDWNAAGYRLPLEGEWQYAAGYIDGSIWNESINISGASDNFTSTINDFSWNINNSINTSVGGAKKANNAGIFDMSGNVREWCWDWYSPYPYTAVTHYTGYKSAAVERIVRGGSITDDLSKLQTGYRDKKSPDYTSAYTGFRIAKKASNEKILSVVYDGNGNTAGEVIEYTMYFKENSIVTPEDMDSLKKVEDGISFRLSGWDNGSIIINKGSTFTITENTVLKAVWEEIPKFSVKFIDSDNIETIYETLNIIEAETVSAVSAPAKGGYNFTGWFKDQECTEPWDFSTVIMSDTIIYAGWEEL